MWVIETLIVCFALQGCLPPMGRDVNASHLWAVSATKEGCEQDMVDYSHTVAAKSGDEIIYIKAVCERLGA